MSTTTPPPEQWFRAAVRACREGVTITQDPGGHWRATSGRDPHRTYDLDITGNIARGCSCPAGTHDHEVCKHRAAFYVAAGAIETPPDHDPVLAPYVAEARAAGTPEPHLATVARYLQDLAERCPECGGGGLLYSRDCERAGWPHPTCHVCRGSGRRQKTQHH